MNLMRYFLLLTLNFLVLMVNAQELQFIEETKDYILKECDSVYYYSHGLPPKDDFVLDTTKIHKVNGVLTLPLDNGKEVEVKNTESYGKKPSKKFELYFGENKMSGYYLLGESLEEGDVCGYGNVYYLVNKRNGKVESVGRYPFFSPTNLFFGFIFLKNYWLEKGGIKYINLQSKKTSKIRLKKGLPIEFKWLDDRSFLFSTISWIGTKQELTIMKYYLVQIKQ